MAASDLARTWWASSSEFRRGRFWQAAQTQLEGGDRRVLVVGPGKDDPRYHLTEAAVAFLKRSGFKPETLGGPLELVDHRREARDFPRVLALPISIGSSAELLDLIAESLRTETPQSGAESDLSIVLPKAHVDGYLARLVRHHHKGEPRYCGAIDDEVDPELGVQLLAGLAGGLTAKLGVGLARKETESAPDASSIQARELETGEPERAGGVGRAAGIAGALAAVPVALAAILGKTTVREDVGMALGLLVAVALLVGYERIVRPLRGTGWVIGALVLLACPAAGLVIAHRWDRSSVKYHVISTARKEVLVPHVSPSSTSTRANFALDIGERVTVECITTSPHGRWARLDSDTFVPLRDLTPVEGSNQAQGC